MNIDSISKQELLKENEKLKKKIENYKNTFGPQVAYPIDFNSLTKIIDSIPAAILITQNSEYVFSNQSAATMLGYERPEDVVGLSTMSCIAPEFHDIILQRIENTKAGIDNESIEIDVIHPNGNRRTIETTSRPFTFYGKPAALISCKDITLQKKYENETLKERQRIYDVLNKLPALIYLQRPDYKVEFANKRFIEVFGEPEDRLCYEIFHGRSEPCEHCLTFDVLKNGKSRVYEYVDDAGNAYLWNEIRFTEDTDSHYVLEVGLDISKLKQTEMLLETSRENYRKLFNLAPLGLIVIDADSNILESNYYFESKFNVTSDDLKGKNLYEIPYIDKKSHSSMRENFANRKQGNEVSPYNVKLTTKEGLPVYVEITGASINEQEEHYLIALRDVTAQVKSEIELTFSRDRMQALSDASFEAIFFSEKGVCFDQNLQAVRMFGYSHDEALGKLGTEWIVPEDRDYVMQNMIKGIEEPYEATALRKDGTTFPCEIQGRMIEREGKQVRVTSVRDISLRREVEKKLKDSKQFLEGLLSNMPGMAYRCQNDSNWTMEYISHACKAMTGYDAVDLIGGAKLNYGDLIVKEDKKTVWKKVQNSLTKTGHFQLEYRIRNSNGEIRWFWERGIGVYEDERFIALEGFISDITEQKESVQLLAKSENKFRTLFENMVQGVFYQNSDGRLTDVNNAALEIFGLSRDQFLGRTSMHPEWRVIDMNGKTLSGDKHPSMIALNTGKPVFNFNAGIYNPVVKANRWISINAIPQFDERSKKVCQVFVTIHDITTERNSEQKLRDIFEHSSNLFYSHGTDHKLHYLSPQTRQFFDCSQEEAYEHWTEFVTDNPVNETGFDITMKAIETGTIQPPYELELKGLNDRIIWVEVHEAPVVVDGKTEKMVGALVDITDRKKAEAELIENEKRFRTLFAAVSDMITIVSLDENGYSDKYLDVNDVTCQVFEYSKNELLRMGPRDIHDPEYEFDPGETVTELASYGHAVFERRIITKSGKNILIEANAHRLEYMGQEVMISVSRDITRRREIEAELAKAEKLESIGVLAGGIAHDFNNILVAILGNISLAKMDSVIDSDSYKALAKAERASERAADLTMRLLTFSKGGAPIIKSTSIVDVIKDSAGFSLHGSNVKCDFNFEENLWEVEADEGQISQVINNLVINADHAMPKGGRIRIAAINKTIKKSTKLALDEGDFVKITIRDEGIGIRKKDLNRIFDPFFSTKDQGSGLGLASCYSIVKQHRGIIEVDSQPNKGTVFTIYLPANSKAKPKDKIAKRNADFQGSGKILVMDDDEQILNLSKNILTKYGYEIETSINGNEAIARFKSAIKKKDRFAAVILDLTIPAGDGGVDVLSKLRKIDPRICAIVSSGYSNDPVMSNYEEYGFDACVAKPYKANELLSVLNEALNVDK